MNAIEDKIALKELVDNISIFGDRKDFKSQVQFFAEDAISETVEDGTTILRIEGREEMEKAFAEFLQDMETVYHFNGQQVVSLNGDQARGRCYCLITLISNDQGKKTKTTIGATYEDDYIRVNRQWYVSKRVGTFEWQDKVEITG